jgi:hypothetical protein
MGVKMDNSEIEKWAKIQNEANVFAGKCWFYWLIGILPCGLITGHWFLSMFWPIVAPVMLFKYLGDISQWLEAVGRG